MAYKTALQRDEETNNSPSSPIKTPSQEAEYKIDQIRGNNPNEWPKNLM